jgi:hypothetical protein
MLGDLLLALPIGLLGGLAAGFALFAGPDAGAARVRLLFAALLALAVTAQFSPAFTGYHADLWMYLTAAGRIADGEWLFDREPFWLEAPDAPSHSILWMGLGLLERATGVSALGGARVVGLLSAAFLCAAAHALARAAFAGPRARWCALFAFLAALAPAWSTLALNRNVALGFVVLAAWRALVFAGRGRDVAWLAVCAALAFYLHAFAGVLALAAVALATVARVRGGEPVHTAALAGALAATLVLALPALLLAWPEAGRAIESAHLRGPGQVELLGLRAFDPAALLHLLSPPVVALAVLGALPRIRAGLTPAARRLAWLGPLAVCALLFTPLYHLVSGVFGGWMAPRLVELSFLWLPAGAALCAAGDPGAPRAARVLAALLAGAVFWMGGARVVRDFRQEDLYFAFDAAAREEARGLRDLLDHRMYVSSATLAYGLAPFTRGHPLAVPPGHASPHHPFAERRRHAHRALASSSRDCWLALAERYPDLAFLVTPAPGAGSEERLWHSEIPGRDPAAVRRALRSWDALETVHEGDHYTVDALHLDGLPGDPRRCEELAPQPL